MEEGKPKPIKLILLLLEATDPKDLPAIERDFERFKAKYSKKTKAKKASIEDIENHGQAQKAARKKAPPRELKWPCEWIVEYIRRSGVPSNWRVKSST